MKFYYWILIIVIALNLIVVFTPVGEYIKTVAAQSSSPNFSFFVLTILSTLLIASAFLVIILRSR